MPDEPAQHPVAQFVGVFELLDQPVAQLFVRRLKLMPREALTKAIDGVDKRG